MDVYGGYVLKYVGDAVLAFFVVEDNNVVDGEHYSSIDEKRKHDNDFYSFQYGDVLACAYTMIKVIREGIDPILDQYDYPELQVRIGMDFG